MDNFFPFRQMIKSDENQAQDLPVFKCKVILIQCKDKQEREDFLDRTEYQIIGNKLVFRTKTKGEHFKLWLANLELDRGLNRNFLRPSSKDEHEMK